MVGNLPLYRGDCLLFRRGKLVPKFGCVAKTRGERTGQEAPRSCWAKYSRSEIRSEFVFQLLNRIGPGERFGGLIVASDEIEDGLL